MKRSPLLHLALGALVITYAYIAGTLMHSDQPHPGLAEDAGYHMPHLPSGPRNFDLIVKFKDGTSNSVIEQLASRLNANILENYSELKGFSFESVKTTEDMDLQQ